MPKAFEKCVKNGGKVRTVSGPSKKHGLDDGEYVKYCTDKNGKTHRGEVKKKSKKSNNSEQGASMALQNNMKIPKSGLCINDAAVVKLSEGNDDEPRKAALLAYSGKVIKGHWLWGDLAIDVSGIQFKRKRYPILEEHNTDRKVGFSNKLPDTDKGAVEFAEIQLLNNPVAQEFYDNSKAGFPYQASISIKPTVIEELGEDEKTEVNGMTMKGPGIVFRKSIYRETSVCVHGYDSNTKSQALSDNEENVELSVDIIKQGKKVDSKETQEPDDGGKIMKLSELKEQYPQLVAELTEEIKGAFTEEISKKDQEIQGLKQKNTELSGANEDLGKRVSALENENILRKEGNLKLSVQNTVNDKLKDSNIPSRLHDRFTERFSYNSYINEQNEIDTEKLHKDIDAEIQHWEASLAEVSGTGEPVRGFSKSNNVVNPGKKGTEFSEEDADSITQRILAHVGVKVPEKSE
jgi:hypothetical protein